MLSEREMSALRDALTRAGVRLDGQPEVNTTPWRQAGAREAVDNELPSRPLGPLAAEHARRDARVVKP